MTFEFVPKRYKGETTFTGVPCNRGHVAPRYVKFGGCVECVRENNQKRIKANKETLRQRHREWIENNRQYANARRKQYHIDNPERRMVAAARKTSKNLGLSFDLEWTDIRIPDKCPILGMPIQKQLDKRSGSSPSLDRITPSRGYVKDNVIVISWRANRIKCDATVGELRKIADFYEKLTSSNK